MSRKKTTKSDFLRELHPMESLGNAPARAGEIRVERLESRLKPKVPFPHKHGFYHLLFLERGSGWHEIDFVKFQVKGRQFYLVKPGEVHSWNLNASTCGYVLEFTNSSLETSPAHERLIRGLDRWPARFSVSTAKEAETLLQLMLNEFEQREAGFSFVLERLLSVFLLQLDRSIGKADPAAGKKTSALQKFQELVEENYQRHHSVEYYAGRLGITTKSLTTLCSKATGRSAGALIQDRCLIEAKRLLAYTELAIAEIGYRLGYDDPNYFARFFRQKTGLSPGKFRKLAAHSVPH